ncbi:DEAD box RNA helicase family protein [Heracleum sosnowskyi]|uniref:RNA helicase n=1 Tax=Heracleum sosnowskyi TaxID=360622 RepID=A0AAD8H4H9_9APIA|nr:DEAD box RNA helicase family protein [Heracleum sosnowskyi]
MVISIYHRLKVDLTRFKKAEASDILDIEKTLPKIKAIHKLTIHIFSQLLVCIYLFSSHNPFDFTFDTTSFWTHQSLDMAVVYAPEDPTLPKPWKGLLDGSTGTIYYWNQETNVTQYEKPCDNSITDDDERYNRGSNGVSKIDSGAGTYQSRKVGPAVENGASAASYQQRNEITVSGDDVPMPMTSFEEIGLPSEILRELLQAGFPSPTPIQAQSWPIALQSRDIVAIAKTGSGKTLGYLIPAFMHLKRVRKNPQMGPTVLVLSPTRELATQIQDEAVKFGRSARISCTCLYGGAPKGPQLRDLSRGVDIVVATPGRLNDILEMRRIRKIVKEIPARRQTLMYTATWPKEVRKIAADLLVNPVQVNIGNVNELVANKAITQNVEIVSPMEKQRRVEQIVRSQEPGSKIIIFCSTKKMCDQLTRSLSRQFGTAAIHGDKSQGERDYVLNQFRTGRCPVLVATDVAARGLDIKDIRVVINYDFPNGVEDYVHRIGRTGRAGASGIAYTFLGDKDAKHASDLIKVLEGANQRVPNEIRGMSSRGGGFGRARRQWGSGPGGRDGGRGGHYDSGYGGGRSGWGNGSRDSDRSAPTSYHKRFHESSGGGPAKRSRVE